MPADQFGELSHSIEFSRTFSRLAYVLASDPLGLDVNLRQRPRRQVCGFHSRSVARIPGLKIETWGTLRFVTERVVG